ncbi:hypothetical protein [Desulfohalobium retbaense]|uniref:hypothetical protein n=1 Tax=Desulfohalobium retbaense TaxID=45663 RepID=UPI001427CB99|nr:hypothetical protein [Desulfohalobium retbaense]
MAAQNRTCSSLNNPKGKAQKTFKVAAYMEYARVRMFCRFAAIGRFSATSTNGCSKPHPQVAQKSQGTAQKTFKVAAYMEYVRV